MSTSSSDRFSFPSILLRTTAAGAAVGLVDGVRAGVSARLAAPELAGTTLLVLGQDVVLAALLGAGLGLLIHLARWGGAARPPRWAVIGGWVLAGLISGAVGVAATGATAMRHNRFLAAGVVAVAVGIAGLLAALIAPALARVLSARAGEARDSDQRRRITWAGALLLAPLVAAAVLGGLLALVSSARAPLRGVRLGQLMAAVAPLSAVLPAALALVSRLLPRLPRRWALPAFAALFLAPAAAVVARRWNSDFQFVRWKDVAVLVSVVLLVPASTHLRWTDLSRWGRRRILLSAAAATAAGLALFLMAGASEPARKAAVAHAGWAAPVMGAARLVLDLDGDGYTSLLGGGDCADRSEDINPGAQEWPDDGVDQNCDGKDASTASVRTLPLHPVPAAIPRDLNLLLVTIDTLRADHLGSYGYRRRTSPQMDRLAAEGILFESGWAHAPSTRYSMPALATGRWPSTIAWQDCHACDRFWPRIGADNLTIGEALKNEGYTTGAFYAYSYFKREYQRGFERGIDDYQDQRASLHGDVNGDPAKSIGTSARQMADDAIAFFDRQRDKSEQPGHRWFLWLHFYDPHLGYERHPEAPDFGSSQVDLYDGEIWFTDHHLGRVLDSLRQRGLWDRTAVMVTGDHGEGLGEHGISAHGYHLYPPQTKVPFIWRVPGLPPRRVPQAVGHVDVAPTLVNLARGAPVKSFLGRSMLDLMTGAPAAAVPHGPVFQEVTFEGPASPFDGTRRRGLVTAERHLLWNWMPDNTTECYDLRADPGEDRDLWGTSAGESCVPLKGQLQDLVQLFSLPLDVGEKLSRGVSAAGAPAPAPAHPLAAGIGPVVRYLGYDLASTTAVRGRDLEVTHHFEVVERIPKGWKIFFHLDGPGGVRNFDHVPVEGAYPLERWRPGQRIRDRQRIPISAGTDMAPGSYTLHVGLWKGNERMPVTPPSAADGANRLRVVTFHVP